ncbi:hypothetical protein [Rhodococcus sp. WS3]|nr:hypothetical protein [Rhodococcus sp. WS3]
MSSSSSAPIPPSIALTWAGLGAGAVVGDCPLDDGPLVFAAEGGLELA